MFIWLRMQGFESLVNEDLQKEIGIVMSGNQVPVLAPGGSIFPGYFLQLLFIEKSKKIV